MPSSRLPRATVLLAPALLLAAALPTAARATDATDPAPAPALLQLQAATAPLVLAAAEVDCMAKVVLHEAGAEPRQGKVAVAQTLINRRDAGRFGASICAVANQRGQFFNTDAFHPNRDGNAWSDAVAVSRAVLSGAEAMAVPGALFFRGASFPASSFFRTRARVAAIGRQIFYR